jgi:hypothetical protein
LPHSLRISFTSDYFEDNHSDESEDNSDHKEQNTTLLSTLQSLVASKSQKRKHTFKGVMHLFPRMTHRRYLSRFRMYLQNKQTKN